MFGEEVFKEGEIISGNFFFCFPFSVEWSGVECGGMGEERERRRKEEGNGDVFIIMEY